MQITIIALGSTGDILPYAALGHHLKSRGLGVVFVSSSNYKRLIEDLGLRFLGITGDAQSIVRASSANIFALFKAFAELSKGLTHLLMPDHPELQRTKLIINQLPIGLYGYDLAEKLGVPMIQAAVIPLTPTAEFPMAGWPELGMKSGSYNRASYQLYEKLTWLTMRRTINYWRQNTLSLPRRPLKAYWKACRPTTIYGFSRHVLSKPLDWSDRVHICGYWFHKNEDWEAPEELSSFIQSGSSPIYIGFGSMPVPDIKKTTKMLVKAIKRSGQRAIIHAGWAKIAEPNLPDSIYLVDYVPYQWLFPKMTAVIHHGGSGTSGSVLWSGVPSLAVPFLFDQSFWGKKAAELGAGLAPIPFKKLNEEQLTRSIEILMREDSYKIAASEVSKQIRKENGIHEAADIVEKLLDV